MIQQVATNERRNIGKLIYMVSMSIDGFMQVPEEDSDWDFPDEEVHQHFNDLERSIDTQIYGRKMYELMASYWPTADQNPSASAVEVEYAQIWREMPKIVFSQSLERVDWNARLVRTDAVAEVARLKLIPDKTMSVGGTELASSLAKAGLIDEFRLYIVPIIVGAGKTPLPQLRERIKVLPLEVHTFKSGVVLLHYGADGA
jgi:dihydrofolate reductase